MKAATALMRFFHPSLTGPEDLGSEFPLSFHSQVIKRNESINEELGIHKSPCYSTVPTFYYLLQYLLPTTYYLLPTTYYLLPTTVPTTVLYCTFYGTVLYLLYYLLPTVCYCTWYSTVLLMEGCPGAPEGVDILLLVPYSYINPRLTD